jgi:hypothetical protein
LPVQVEDPTGEPVALPESAPNPTEPAAGPPPMAVEPGPTLEPIPVATEPRSNTVQGDGDPMMAVDAFLTRNRKEADDSIQALTKEAEALRARLQKVEAALARWHHVSEALEQKAEPGRRMELPAPSPRARWKQPDQGPPTPPPGPDDVILRPVPESEVPGRIRRPEPQPVPEAVQPPAESDPATLPIPAPR